MDQFILASPETRKQLICIVQGFHSPLNSSEDAFNFLRYVEQLHHQMIDELSELDCCLGGLAAYMNLFNFFTLARNYKNKTKGIHRLPNPCGHAAQPALRHIMDRIQCHVEKFFLYAPCSGVDIPKPLAHAMFTFMMELKGKFGGINRTLGVGRRLLQAQTEKVLTTAASLKAAGVLPVRTEAFCMLVFQFPDISQLFAPLYQTVYHPHVPANAFFHGANNMLIRKPRCIYPSTQGVRQFKAYMLREFFLDDMSVASPEDFSDILVDADTIVQTIIKSRDPLPRVVLNDEGNYIVEDINDGKDKSGQGSENQNKDPVASILQRDSNLPKDSTNSRCQISQVETSQSGILSSGPQSVNSPPQAGPSGYIQLQKMSSHLQSGGSGDMVDMGQMSFSPSVSLQSPEQELFSPCTSDTLSADSTPDIILASLMAANIESMTSENPQEPISVAPALDTSEFLAPVPPSNDKRKREGKSLKKTKKMKNVEEHSSQASAASHESGMPWKKDPQTHQSTNILDLMAQAVEELPPPGPTQGVFQGSHNPSQFCESSLVEQVYDSNKASTSTASTFEKHKAFIDTRTHPTSQEVNAATDWVQAYLGDPEELPSDDVLLQDILDSLYSEEVETPPAHKEESSSSSASMEVAVRGGAPKESNEYNWEEVFASSFQLHQLHLGDDLFFDFNE